MASGDWNSPACILQAPPTPVREQSRRHALMEKMAEYCGRMKLFVVPFTEIQEQIRDRCPEELFTIIMRRFMMRIADQLARKQDCGALITGESVGQVASQTVKAIACTDIVTDLPVFRPVIGMDKREIIAIANEIDTFETSILPYEDCCTVFTPKHPRTRPRLDLVRGGGADAGCGRADRRSGCRNRTGRDKKIRPVDGKREENVG